MIKVFNYFYQILRQMKLNNELNNMSWRVRPDDVLLEVGRLYGSKVGLQKLNTEVCCLKYYYLLKSDKSVTRVNRIENKYIKASFKIVRIE